MRVSLVIPMYNEAARVPQTLARLTAYLEQTLPGQHELIFVNDGSTDDSAALVSACGKETVRLVSYETNRGKGYAVRQGMLAASGEVVLFTDCDLAYGTGAIGDLWRAFEEHPDADVVTGSRKLLAEGYEGYTKKRKMLSKVYYFVVSVLTGLKLSDSQCGLKGFRRAVVQAVFPHCRVNRFAFDLEVLMLAQKAGATMLEIPAKILEHGESSMHLLRDSLTMLRDLLRIRRTVRKTHLPPPP
ncbi:MAG: dolichyl-phosphate beta-glucosyltransferase, partial [Eubacteriales bacterium]